MPGERWLQDGHSLNWNQTGRLILWSALVCNMLPACCCPYRMNLCTTVTDSDVARAQNALKAGMIGQLNGTCSLYHSGPATWTIQTAIFVLFILKKFKKWMFLRPQVCRPLSYHASSKRCFHTLHQSKLTTTPSCRHNTNLWRHRQTHPELRTAYSSCRVERPYRCKSIR